MDEPELPGADLVRAGLADLERGVESVEALLVEIGAPRLRRLGAKIVCLTSSLERGSPEHRLYARLESALGAGAYSQYNALLRRLVSYERALELYVRLTREAATDHVQ
ncbi:MAG: hypothetical protein HYV63_24745 [Candidatus Schekmanbacteria bacterium]|nr:hypothetical protein [Candidatus Schekmanbacteria bacterium]